MLKVDTKIELFLLILFYTAFLSAWEVPQALDLVRYYEKALKASYYFHSPMQYLLYNIEVNVDFLYNFILYLFAKFGWNLNVVTIMFMFAYSGIALITWQYCFGERVKLVNVVTLCGLFSAPIIWSFSISRTLAAVSLLYAAIFFIIRHKYYLALVFCTLSIFTHISMLLFVVLVFFAFFLQKISFINKYYATIFVVASILVYVFAMSSNYFEPILQLLNMGESRYSIYSEMSKRNFFSNSSLGMYDKLPVLFNLMLCIIMIYFNKVHDFIWWNLYVYTIVLIGVVFTNVMLTQRITIVMPLFIGYNLYACIKNNELSIPYVENVVSIICCLGLVISFYNVFGYRVYFHFLF